MHIFKILKSKNEKGFVLISTYMLAAAMVIIAGASFTKSIYEAKLVDREFDRLQSHYVAEAGLQSALAQMGTNAYTGFINANAISIMNFQSVSGASIGNVNVTLNYPEEADWVIAQSVATVNGVTRRLEGRVFLDSNLSKYLIYINITNLNVGNNAKFGYNDGTNPEGVPANWKDRMAMYFTGDWSVTGSNVDVWGDLHAEGDADAAGTTLIHGDTYMGDFATNSSGQVTNDGVSGPITVGDGFSDDVDRNGDGQITSSDYADQHDLTQVGGGDSHAEESLTQIDHNFYEDNNNIPSFGSGTQNRYLIFQENGDHTRMVEYSNATFTTQVATYELPSSAIVYVNGDAYVKGYIKGRVSLVTSDDIFVDGDMVYAGSSPYASDPTHSAAFLAKDKVYFRPDILKVSGIIYGENTSGSTNPIDASVDLNGNTDNSKAQLRTYGNIVANGQPNTSIYSDRIFGYDKNLKKYRPPGIPIQPTLRTVREY